MQALKPALFRVRQERLHWHIQVLSFVLRFQLVLFYRSPFRLYWRAELCPAGAVPLRQPLLLSTPLPAMAANSGASPEAIGAVIRARKVGS